MPAPTFQYIDCDIPEGMSIRQWRQDRALASGRPHHLRSLFSRAWRAFAF